jgi:hypothetical protein
VSRPRGPQRKGLNNYGKIAATLFGGGVVDITSQCS